MPIASILAHVRKYLRKRGVSRADADDIGQDVYMRIERYIRQGMEVRNLKALAITAARNLHIDAHRRTTVRAADPRPLEKILLLDTSTGPEDTAANQRRLELVKQVLRKHCSPNTEEAYFLHAEGYTYKEIGKLMNLSPRYIERLIADADTALTLHLPGDA